MLIVQLSDLHVRPDGQLLLGRVDSNAATARAVDAVLRLDPAPDAVLVTGDLAEAGLAEEYAVVRRELDRLAMPVYVIPGNHDRREPMRAAFADAGYLPAEGDFLHYVVDIGPLRLMALDTVIPGEPEGEIDALRLAWLQEQLEAAAPRPVLIAMHHPPFATGIGHMDAMGCRGHGLLQALIAGYPNVERVLCGHVHRPVQARFGGTIASIAPSVAHQVALDLRPHAPATFTLEPGAFHVHGFELMTGVVTHQAYVDPFQGPFPFA